MDILIGIEIGKLHCSGYKACNLMLSQGRQYFSVHMRITHIRSPLFRHNSLEHLKRCLDGVFSNQMIGVIVRQRTDTFQGIIAGREHIYTTGGKTTDRIAPRNHSDRSAHVRKRDGRHHP